MIAVVHLVWGPLGITWPRQFLDSYRRHRAGVEHQLVLLLNNVDAELRSELIAELDGLDYRLIDLDEPVQDLLAYAEAAKRLASDRLCFLNSYSTVLCDDWLAKLDDALDQPGAGLVGASGSWASLHSAVLNAFLIPNPYRAAVPKRSVAREQMRAIELELDTIRLGTTTPDASPELPPRSLSRSIVSTLRSFGPMPEQLLRFERFPAYHLRTNAFMLDRSPFLNFEMGRIVRKMDAYLMESGRHSFTRQVQRGGRRTLLVTCDGGVYDHDQWPAARAFWQGDQ